MTSVTRIAQQAARGRANREQRQNATQGRLKVMPNDALAREIRLAAAELASRGSTARGLLIDVLQSEHEDACLAQRLSQLGNHAPAQEG